MRKTGLLHLLVIVVLVIAVITAEWWWPRILSSAPAATETNQAVACHRSSERIRVRIFERVRLFDRFRSSTRC
jgi:hypothetical protein